MNPVLHNKTKTSGVAATATRRPVIGLSACAHAFSRPCRRLRPARDPRPRPRAAGQAALVRPRWSAPCATEPCPERSSCGRGHRARGDEEARSCHSLATRRLQGPPDERCQPERRMCVDLNKVTPQSDYPSTSSTIPGQPPRAGCAAPGSSLSHVDARPRDAALIASPTARNPRLSGVVPTYSDSSMLGVRAVSVSHRRQTDSHTHGRASSLPRSPGNVGPSASPPS